MTKYFTVSIFISVTYKESPYLFTTPSFPCDIFHYGNEMSLRKMKGTRYSLKPMKFDIYIPYKDYMWNEMIDLTIGFS